ncbi:MAG TPA: hypothetical protein VHB47_09825 [Thermoanaerobaculia bacterium]|nr:hypothetical protein [Thermoanaerobaculia bacterium]
MNDKPLLSIHQLVQVANTYLFGVEAQIREAVLDNLAAKEDGQWSGPDDLLFAAFNEYVRPAWLLGFPLRPVRLWVVDLSPVVVQLESRIGAIHKGAPLFNVGLCFYAAGDYARGLQYIGAAGDEEERRGLGGAARLLTGEGFSEQVLLKPLYAWLEATFGADYKDATGCSFDGAEFREVVRFLAARLGDATLLLAALRSFVSQVEGPDNHSSRLERVRAFAEALLVYESSLRRWQGATVSGQLFKRTEALLVPNGTAIATFRTRHLAYSGRDLERASELNRLIGEECAAFMSAGSRAERAAIAAFVCYRLRNSVMHVVDDQLDIFSQPPLLVKVLGFCLISIRLSRFGHDGQMAQL